MYLVVARMRRLLSESISNSPSASIQSAMDPLHCDFTGIQLNSSPPALAAEMSRAATSTAENMKHRKRELRIVVCQWSLFWRESAVNIAGWQGIMQLVLIFYEFSKLPLQLFIPYNHVISIKFGIKFSLDDDRKIFLG